MLDEQLGSFKEKTIMIKKRKKKNPNLYNLELFKRIKKIFFFINKRVFQKI